MPATLKQQLLDSIKQASIPPEVQVDLAMNDLWKALAEIDRLRMQHDTADFVLKEADQFAGATAMAVDLRNDIWAARYKGAAE